MLDRTAADIQFLTYIFAPVEGKFLCSVIPLQNISPFLQFSVGKYDHQIMKDCEKYTQVKYSNMNYMQEIHMLHSIFQIYS